MQMEAGLDTGPVLLRRALPIAADDTGGTLHDKLAALGAMALRDALQSVLDGQTLSPQRQSDDGITYAHKLDKAEARIDWNESAIAIERKVRAFDPWPIAEADVGNDRLRIWSALALPSRAERAPGSIVSADKNGIDVATGDGVLRIREVQRAGGRRMSVGDYLNARPDLTRTS